MAERERRMTRPAGGVFVARSRVMDADDIARATRRMAHEIIEANAGLDDVCLIGLQTGGVPLARALVDALAEIEGTEDRPIDVPLGRLDVAFHRDDIGLRPTMPEAITDVPFHLDGKVVVLVDERTSSDAEIFALAARRLGVGTVIGQRTWGGAVGYSGDAELALVDGSGAF